MLDKQQVFTQLQQAVPEILKQAECEYSIIKLLWERSTAYKLLESVQQAGITWLEPIYTSYPVSTYTQPYRVLGIDGSQIYPDKHQGISCFLLNMGIVHLTYLHDSAQVQLSCVPLLSTHIPDSELSSTEWVNCRRAELELQTALQEGIKAQKHTTDIGLLPTVVLFDGPVYFWHYYAQDQQRKIAAKHYAQVLYEFYKAELPVLGYTSLPKNRDLLALLQTVVAHNKTFFADIFTDNSKLHEYTFECSTDADICQLFLTQDTRTCVFAEHTYFYQYASELQPCFVYVDIGDELVRIEFSRWLVDQPAVFNYALEIIKDQCVKGRGYPVALAEAHEQAVIKSADRDYFYQLLHTVVTQAGQTYTYSKKSLKKRFIAF